MENPTSWFAFKMDVTRPPASDDLGEVEAIAETHTSVDRADADELAKRLGMERIEDCAYLGFESSIPQIDADKFGDMHDFDQLNNLFGNDARNVPVGSGQIQGGAFRRRTRKIEQILDIARSLDQYEFAPMVEDEAHFFKVISSAILMRKSIQDGLTAFSQETKEQNSWSVSVEHSPITV